MKIKKKHLHLVLAAVGVLGVLVAALAFASSAAADIGPFVQPRELDDPAMLIHNAQGRLPCGTFNVLKWGHRVALLTDYPPCQPPDLTVMCLNENGEWSADNISDVTVHVAVPPDEPPEASTVAFQVGQHGTCGIFAK